MRSHLGAILVAVLCSSGPGPHEVYAADPSSSSPRPVETSGRPRLVVPIGHTAPVSCVAFSADGHFALTGGIDGALILWQVAGQIEIRRFDCSQVVDRVAVSPEGRFVAARGADDAIYLFDGATGDMLLRSDDAEDSSVALAFSTNLRYFAAAREDKPPLIWDLRSRTELADLSAKIGVCVSVGFTSSEGILTTSAGGSEATLWDTAHNVVVRRYPCKGSILAASPDGRTALVREESGPTVALVDASTGTVISPIPFELDDRPWSESVACSVATVADVGWVAIGVGNGAVRVWSVPSGMEIQPVEPDPRPRKRRDEPIVTLSPDGHLLAVEAPGNAVSLVDVSTGLEVGRLQGRARPLESAWFSTDGQAVHTRTIELSSSQNIYGSSASIAVPDLSVWDLTSGSALRFNQILDPDAVVVTAAISPDGTLVALGGDGLIRLIDVASGAETRRVSAGVGWINSLTFYPDGRRILAACDDGTVRQWDTITGRAGTGFDPNAGVAHVVGLSSDGKIAIVGCEKGAFIWHVDGSEPTRTLSANPNMQVTAVAVSRDGRLAAVAQRLRREDKSWTDPAVVIQDTSSEREIARLSPADDARSMAFSSNGRLLMVCSDRGTSMVDLATSKTRPIDAHGICAAFLPGGRGTLIGGKVGGEVSAVVLGPSNMPVVQFVDRSDVVQRVATEALAVSENGAIALTVDSDLNVPVDPEESAGLRTNPDGRLDAARVDKCGLTVRLWSTKDGTLLGRFRRILARDARLSDDGSRALVIPQGQSAAMLVDAHHRRVLARLGHEAEVTKATFSSSGLFAATGDRTGQVNIWNVTTQACLNTVACKGAVVRLEFSPDERRLLISVVGESENTTLLWDRDTGRECWRSTEPVEAILGFSRDGRYVLFGGNIDSDSASVMALDTRSGERVTSLQHDVEIASESEEQDDERSEYTRVLAESPDLGEVVTSADRASLNRDPTQSNTVADLRSASAITITGPTPKLRVDLHTGAILTAADYSPDGTRIVTSGFDGAARLWDRESGKELCWLVSLPGDVWIAGSPDGRFDTNDVESLKQVYWVMPDDPFHPLPLEMFMRDYLEPRLVPRLLAGEALPPIRPLSDLSRVQPMVTIEGVKWLDVSRGLATIAVRVRRGVGRFPRGGVTQESSTDVYDLRLFRNGQLVGSAPSSGHGWEDGALVRGPDATIGGVSDWRKATRIAVGADGALTMEFPIAVSRAEGFGYVEFTAYAFNEDRVKSETASLDFAVPQSMPTAKGRAYVIAVGASAYEDASWDLRFAADDARATAAALARGLAATGDYSEVVPVVLTSERKRLRGGRMATLQAATKGKVREVLGVLARGPETADRAAVAGVVGAERLRRVGPEDVVVIAFSSHGYTDAAGKFYLVPYDTGGEVMWEGSQIAEVSLRRFISSDELGQWLRDVDAGELALVVDTCHSAAAVDAEGFKPGPMGSRGMGQLAYDKGMRVLAASQAADVALEVGRLRHGLLTYALVREGLELGKADGDKDGRVTLEEWLRYGEERVPTLYEEVKAGKVKELRARDVEVVGVEAGASTKKGAFQKPSLFDFKRKNRDVVVKRSQRTGQGRRKK